MLRAANAGRQLYRLAAAGTRGACSSGSASEGASSVASLIRDIKGANSASFAAGGLSELKAGLQPHYPAAAADKGLSVNAQVALGIGAAYFLYKAGVHASSPDWIVDLSLDVLQSAWWISFLSILPFRSIYASLRAMTPHSAGPLTALRPAAFIKP